MAISYEDRYEQVGYLAGGEIGEMPKGAMSEVVYVKDGKGEHENPIVLKRPVISDRSKELSPFEGQKRALEREIFALELLNKSDIFSINIPEMLSSGKHPGRIVPGKDYYSPPPHNYLIMTHASGLPLDKVSPVPPLIAVFNIFPIIIGELKKIHEIGIVYNDARDHHIIWDKDIDPIAKNPKSLTLVDFGNVFFYKDSELAKYNAEIFKNPQPIDDFQQLGGSLYKLLTGNGFSDQNINDLIVKPQYEIIEELFDTKLILSIIKYIYKGNTTHAQEELLGLAQMLEQEREIFFARITREIETSQPDLEEESILDERTINIVSYPTLEFSKRWNSFIKEKEYERIRLSIRDNIQNELWARILDQDVQQLESHNAYLAKTIRELIASIINQSVTNNEIYQEQLNILLYVIDEKHEEAKNTLVDFISELKETAYEHIIPFLSQSVRMIGRISDNYLLHYDEPDNFKRLALATSPHAVLEFYKELSQRGVNQTYTEIIDNLEKAVSTWEKLDLILTGSIVSERLISKDIFNPALYFWKNSILEYERWLRETIIWPSSLPEVSNYSHPLLEKFNSTEDENITEKNIYDQLELIDTASQLIHPKFNKPEARQSFIDWEKREKDHIHPRIIDEVKKAFETEKSNLLSKIQDPEFPLTKYLSVKENELLGILKSLSALSECSPDYLEKLPEVAKEIKNNKLQDSKYQGYWDLIEATLSYLNVASSGAANVYEIAFDFKSKSQQNRDQLHWLYHQFIVPEHLIKPTVDRSRHAIEETTEDVSSTKFWLKMPKPAKSIISIVTFGIMITLAYFVFNYASARLYENDAVKATQQIESQINIDDKEQCAVFLSTEIQGIEYDPTLFNEACNHAETRQLAYNQLVITISSSLAKKYYPPQINDIILQISTWGLEDTSKLVNLGYCGQFLTHLQENDFISSRDWISERFGVTHNTDWTSICGWNPLELHLSEGQIHSSYEGNFVFAEDGTANLFDGLSDSSYSLIPYSFRHYSAEITTNLDPSYSPAFIISETTLPDEKIVITANELVSLNPDFSQRIIRIDWFYSSNYLEIYYNVYAPKDAVTAIVQEGQGYFHLSVIYQIPESLLKQLNQRKSLQIGDIIFLIDPNTPTEFIDGQQWYILSSGMQKIEFALASLTKPNLIGYFGQDQVKTSIFSVNVYFSNTNFP